MYDTLKISNYEDKHMICKLKDTTHSKIDQNRNYYDNALMVKIKLNPFILMIGNNEY